MLSLETEIEEARTRNVRVDEDSLIVDLVDSRNFGCSADLVSASLAWTSRRKRES